MKKSFNELYLVVDAGWIPHTYELYDKQTALELADELGLEIESLDNWLTYLGVIA